MRENPATQDSRSKPAAEQTVIGWREYIALPEWGVDHIKTKIDTGARTSAIDVANMEILDGDRVRFDLVVARRRGPAGAGAGKPEKRVSVETKVVRNAKVKSSFGELHTRPVIETRIRIGPIEKTVQLGLVCRREMTCRMLLGRSALAPDLVVDSSHRYLFGRRPRKTKRT